MAINAYAPRYVPRLQRYPDPEPPDEVDPVDQAGIESFPASDPPCWTLGQERRKRDVQVVVTRITRY